SRFPFFFSSRRRHTRSDRDWSSDVCSSDLGTTPFTRGVDGSNSFTYSLTLPKRELGVPSSERLRGDVHAMRTAWSAKQSITRLMIPAKLATARMEKLLVSLRPAFSKSARSVARIVRSREAASARRRGLAVFPESWCVTRWSRLVFGRATRRVGAAGRRG